VARTPRKSEHRPLERRVDALERGHRAMRKDLTGLRKDTREQTGFILGMRANLALIKWMIPAIPVVVVALWWLFTHVAR
jgi:hypothetical protein